MSQTLAAARAGGCASIRNNGPLGFSLESNMVLTHNEPFKLRNLLNLRLHFTLRPLHLRLRVFDQ
jgi:hypothetical protein